MERIAKKIKAEVFDLPFATTAKSQEDVHNAYYEAIKTHPFYDNADSVADAYKDVTFRDGEGNILGVLIRRGLPEFAAKMAADVLRPAATRTSLRMSIFGGEAPHSGIAGYFDYRGSPIEFKNRKTAFTHEHEDSWHGVFPMVDYVSSIYRTVMPAHWAKQDGAIPDVVRIHGSPFSTLTINSRFRTASHTDAGDFDDGFGCLACLEGDFKGLALSFDNFHVNVVMQPRDVLIFNPHHFHSNTEPEVIDADVTMEWSRLTCVFYYRAALGEVSAYADYNRRRDAALAAGSPRDSLIRTIHKKNNGENFNRPAPVFPVKTTPFTVVAALHCMSRFASHARWLQAWLEAHDDLGGVALLFGEALETPNGIPDRVEKDLYMVLDPSLRHQAAGGFKESDVALNAAVERQKHLELPVLSQHLTAALVNMWREARESWLKEVKAEWAKMVARNPERTDFLWNNRSKMNALFFDLCEVAKQVMIGLLGKEKPSAGEEQSFWTLFAAHLNNASTVELRMPAEAVSLRKLNVKLKDFSFGGTRYFKDMPEDEQRRRLERKRRIEEARKSMPDSPARVTSDWLLNDTFDYQSEDREVDYEGNEWPLPAAHGLAVVFKEVDAREPEPAFAEDGHNTSILKGGNRRAAEILSAPSNRVVRVLVVLPPVTLEKTKERLPDSRKQNARDDTEEARLLQNPAALQLLRQTSPVATLPVNLEEEMVSITYVYRDCEPGTDAFDFVVLQHVLATIKDPAAATAYVQRMRKLAKGCLLVEETDRECRRYYRLKADLRLQYDAVASSCFKTLHRCKYGTANAVIRSKHELETLIGEKCCARFKLRGSALNTMVLLVAGTEAITSDVNFS